jgi:hypothetical protein
MGARSAAKSSERLPKGIYKRGKSYYLRARDTEGRLIRKSFGTDLEAALLLADRIERERQRQKELAPTSLPRLVANWMARHELRSRPRTVDEAKAAARRILAEFGEMDARDLTEERLQAYVAHRRRECGVEANKQGHSGDTRDPQAGGPPEGPCCDAAPRRVAALGIEEEDPAGHRTGRFSAPPADRRSARY